MDVPVPDRHDKCLATADTTIQSMVLVFAIHPIVGHDGFVESCHSSLLLLWSNFHDFVPSCCCGRSPRDPSNAEEIGCDSSYHSYSYLVFSVSESISDFTIQNAQWK